LFPACPGCVQVTFLESIHERNNIPGTILHLLIFDKSKKTSWQEKIFKQERKFKGEKIIVYGM
jgi:hypothetical protein